MDIFQAITALAEMNGVRRDRTNPFEVMPKDIGEITLMHNKKRVNIPKTVENLFNKPEFICSNVKKFWENVKKDPKGYLIETVKEFRVQIVYM